MPWLKKAYLYIASLGSLLMIIIAAVTLVNLGLKVALHADDYYSYPACLAPAPASAGAKSVECDPAQQKAQAEIDLKNRTNQRKRDIAQSLALLIVATPVFLYHWKLAKKE